MKIENSERLLMIADGMMIFEDNNKIYTVVIAAGEKKEIFDYAANGFVALATRPSYLNGKMYLTACGAETAKSEYVDGVTYQIPYLFSIDVKTGEAKKIVNEPVMSFTLTDDAIYYLPFKIRYLYVPDDYRNHPEKVITRLSDESMYTCGLDGKDIRKLYTDSNLGYPVEYTVIEGKLYGTMSYYDGENHKFIDGFYGEIEFESVKVTQTVIPKREGWN